MAKGRRIINAVSGHTSNMPGSLQLLYYAEFILRVYLGEPIYIHREIATFGTRAFP